MVYADAVTYTRIPWHSQYADPVFVIMVVLPSILHVSTVFEHYNDVIMSAMASQITSLKIVYSTIYSDAE